MVAINPGFKMPKTTQTPDAAAPEVAVPVVEAVAVGLGAEAVSPQDAMEHQERFSRESQIDAIEREIAGLSDSNPKKAELLNEVKALRSGSANSMPDAQAIANTMRDKDSAVAKDPEIRDKEAAQVQSTLMGAITGVAAGVTALGAMGDLTHLDGKLGADGKMAGAVLFDHHKDATALTAGLFGENENKTVQIPSAGAEHLFNPAVVNPGSRVAAMQPAKELGAGAGPSLPSRA